MLCSSETRDNARYWVFILGTQPLPGVRGNYYFRLVVLYTKKAPQLSAQELVMFTKNLAAASTKCCPLSDEQQFVCMEDSAKLILGALCRRHEAEPINAAVGHCCDNSYAFRKPCFDDLTVDGTYVSPHSSCDQVIGFKEELCKAQEEEFQTEKRKLLSNLVKQVPLATEMQLQSVTEDFAHLVRKCCQAETRGPCFREEVAVSLPILLALLWLIKLVRQSFPHLIISGLGENQHLGKSL